MSRNLFAVVILTSFVAAQAQPIDPWTRTSPAVADGVTLTMPALQAVVAEQADLIRKIAELSGATDESAAPRGSTSGFARLVECNGLFGYASIQDAIDESEDGDVVVVFPNTCDVGGRWRENINLPPIRIRLQSVNPNDPSIVEMTVIDGTTPMENPFKPAITCTAGASGDTVIQGLTLTNENDHEPYASWGGGVFCDNASPSIWDCRFINCRARVGGGVCYIIDNGGDPGAGGIHNCLFEDNNAWVLGGAISMGQVTPTSNVNVQITDSVFRHNNSPSGGVIHCTSAIGDGLTRCVMSSCNLVGNTAETGIVLANAERGDSVVHLTIRNCVMENNSAANGLIYAKSTHSASTPSTTGSFAIVDIDNCTAVNNVTTVSQLLYARATSTTTHADINIRNSVFWSNVIPIEITEALASGFGAAIRIDYSDFEFNGISGSNVIWGEGNLSAFPDFAAMGETDDAGTPEDPTDDVYIPGDYHLLASSPCIDTGDPSYVSFDGDVDFDSDQRVLNCRIDVGADEFNPAQNPAGDYDANGTVDLDDLNSFISALLDPQACSLERGDTNGDGELNGLDVAGFVLVLLN